MKENTLTRRCKKILYSIYDDYLEDDRKVVFDQIKENDPYLNQIVDDVVHYVTYDLPLQPIILDKLRGKKDVEC